MAWRRLRGACGGPVWQAAMRHQRPRRPDGGVPVGCGFRRLRRRARWRARSRGHAVRAGYGQRGHRSERRRGHLWHGPRHRGAARHAMGCLRRQVSMCVYTRVA
ncbi:hypothetical protein BDA96_03G196400 [Sorghum bicolor]|uniref:Uncharacterized protein n=1 Tax=Sorghum bicolor TaxID=4558 RepID=A0A921UN95_SORBI|nr:hypothetical protein BDA96_03G196400 [Sorghum bicolor]